MKKLLFLLMPLLIITSCSKDDENNDEPTPPPATEEDEIPPTVPKDDSEYLTGGIWTKEKKPFVPPCRVEVRAKLNAATGAWPAIWMMPFDESQPWPTCGEIDIMERLNHDRFVYHTFHSDYIDTYGNKSYPTYSATSNFNSNQFNTFAVEILEREVRILLNGNQAIRYWKEPTYESLGQYPYFTSQYLIVDMQLGGSWVGNVGASELPVEMEVDWVKYYRPSESTMDSTSPDWQLEWSDEFDSESIDETVWSRIPRGTVDWNNTASTDDRCFELSNGTLKLKGIVNPDK